MVFRAIFKIKTTSEFFKDYQNTTKSKDKCYLRSLKNLRAYIFFQIPLETMQLSVNDINEIKIRQ